MNLARTVPATYRAMLGEGGKVSFQAWAIVDNTSWRWIFFMMMPFGVLAIALAQVNLKLPFARRERSIDYAGVLLMAVWVSAFVLYAELGGTHGFATTGMLALVVVGIVSLVAFVRVEQRASEPVLPIRLFRERTFALTSASNFLNGVVTMTIGIMAPVFLQIVGGVNATRSGVLSMPMVVGMLVGSIYTGQMMTRTGRYRIYPIIGSGLLCAAAALFATIGRGTPNRGALHALVCWFDSNPRSRGSLTGQGT